MLQIQNVSSDALQQQTVKLPDGTAFVMTMYFIEQQQGWFITSLTYDTFQLSGYRIVNSPNMLNQFRGIIPFGLACFSSGNREPSLVTDFSNEISILYVLTQAEVQQFYEYLNGQVSS